MPYNCSVGEDSWEFLGLQGDQASQSYRKSTLNMEELLLKLKLKYCGYLMQRANSLEKTPMLGKIEGRERRAWQRVRWLDSITISMDMNLSKLQEIAEDRKAWHAAVHWVTKNWTQWLNKNNLYIYTATAAKLLQSCPTLCDPIDGSPPASPVPAHI